MELSPVPTDIELAALATQTASLLQQNALMLATAESCTGGWIAKLCTDLAGSSAWFDGGVATYSYAAKIALLGVQRTTLERHGAVSEATALEMVSGARDRFGAGVAVSVTGIAGPGGGTPDKPVGTVWIGWQRRDRPPRARRFHFGGDRDAVRRQTVAAALAGVCEALSD